MRISGTSAILAHLRRGRSITGIESLNRFGVYRLADVIFKARRSGMNIITENVRQGKKTFARYRLSRTTKGLILPV